MSVIIEEQETHISWMRGDEYAEIYTSDSTTMTKLDRKVKENPEFWKIKSTNTVSGEIVSKTYICPKRLVSFRNLIPQRDYTKNTEALAKWRKSQTEEAVV